MSTVVRQVIVCMGDRRKYLVGLQLTVVWNNGRVSACHPYRGYCAYPFEMMVVVGVMMVHFMFVNRGTARGEGVAGGTTNGCQCQDAQC